VRIDDGGERKHARGTSHNRKKRSQTHPSPRIGTYRQLDVRLTLAPPAPVRKANGADLGPHANGTISACACDRFAVADRVHGRPPAPTETTIAGADWYAADLTGAVHERVLFQDVEMTESTGTGARFVDCTFRGTDLSCSVLRDSSFEGCTFIRCSLFDTTLTGCKLVGVLFDDCRLDQMRVEGGDWSFVGLPKADLRHARFSDVRMREADLSGARCQGSAITGCDLANATWSRADLSKCDLRGSDLSSLDPLGVAMSGAKVDWHQAVAVARNLGLDVCPD